MKITIEDGEQTVTAECDQDSIPETVAGLLICLTFNPETAKRLMLREAGDDSWLVDKKV